MAEAGRRERRAGALLQRMWATRVCGLDVQHVHFYFFVILPNAVSPRMIPVGFVADFDLMEI